MVGHNHGDVVGPEDLEGLLAAVGAQDTELGGEDRKIIFVLWERQVPYDETYHLATMARQQLRQRPKKIRFPRRICG